MPKKFFMNWQADKSRWRKMLKGKWYFVTPKELGCRPTKDASWKEANAWWTAKLSTISGPVLDRPNTTLLHLLENKGTSMRDAISILSEKNESGKLAAKVLQILASADEYAQSDDDHSEPNALSAAQRLQKGEAISPFIFRTVLGHGGFEVPNEDSTNQKLSEIAEKITNDSPANQEMSVRHHFDEWSSLQISSRKSAARKKMNIHMLGFFMEFMGDAEVSEINEACWVRFYRWLNAKDNFSDNYKKRIFNTAKIFLIYLYEGHLIELPRKLKSKDLIFATTKNEVEIIDDRSLRSFFAAANGQAKLHILLMLNCGMTAQDISELKTHEVDWQKGTITRKRSKTKHHENAPKVTYLLWKKTFELLVRYRSSEENVLLTCGGKPWISDDINIGKYTRIDSISTSFKWLAKKTNLPICPRRLRATAASKLVQHSQFKFYAEYFLAHSGRTVADNHYIVPSEKEFFESLIWLERAFDLEGTTQLVPPLLVSPTIDPDSCIESIRIASHVTYP